MKITKELNLALERVESGCKDGLETLMRPAPLPVPLDVKKKSIQGPRSVSKDVELPDTHHDALLGLGPHVMSETALGQEATLRFLKAKLHVLQ